MTVSVRFEFSDLEARDLLHPLRAIDRDDLELRIRELVRIALGAGAAGRQAALAQVEEYLRNHDELSPEIADPEMPWDHWYEQARNYAALMELPVFARHRYRAMWAAGYSVAEGVRRLPERAVLRLPDETP